MAVKISLVLSMMVYGLVSGAPQMFIWNCDGCEYGTKVNKAAVEFAENSQVKGDLSVQHIIGEDGTNSLEIRGPLEGLTASRAYINIHKDGDCESEPLHQEKCDNCQSYVSIKVLASVKLLSIGGNNDVMNKAISIVDARRGIVGCGKIVSIKP